MESVLQEVLIPLHCHQLRNSSVLEESADSANAIAQRSLAPHGVQTMRPHRQDPAMLSRACPAGRG